ncbi:MAG: hypothetical protein P8Y65_06565, partial [Campylobacterales bacterium]
TLFILFFLTRKESKENRRCANRSFLPALCLRNGFQGTRTDLLSIDLNALRANEANKRKRASTRRSAFNQIKSGLERSLKAVTEA